MAAKKPRARVKDANPRKYKKKTSPLILESIDYVDYKNVDLLNRFMSDRAKIRNRRVTGNDVQQQRDIANAIKVAREMGLLPYARRVASASRQRPPRDGDGGRPSVARLRPRPRSPRARSPPSSMPTRRCRRDRRHRRRDDVIAGDARRPER